MHSVELFGLTEDLSGHQILGGSSLCTAIRRTLRNAFVKSLACMEAPDFAFLASGPPFLGEYINSDLLGY